MNPAIHALQERSTTPTTTTTATTRTTAGSALCTTKDEGPEPRRVKAELEQRMFYLDQV
ncbi:hypothetical protein X777_01443 [Ooceraea biroi]|uniref:Uncharacterized protein n=1 Tax=Ooceraea biroi TaxID=2015173 RepID=A0A026WPS8_OOCBI|nr:hypothetical protein X777_01443 [Ooceraea biroi]